MKFIGVISTVFIICAADTYDHDVGLETQILAFTSVCQPEQIRNWDFSHPMFQDSEVLTNFQLGEIITTDYLQCITGYDPVNERNVISFRGSVNVDNFLSTNFDTIPEPYPHASQLSDPKIHPGFYDAFKELERAGLRDAITAMFAEGEGDILVTGHSLGGALATVAALELKQNPVYQAMYIGRVDLMTFGCPRVVSQELATLLNESMDSSWRIVYRYDIVPTVPTKAMGFYHVGTEVWYNYKRWWWQIDPMVYRVCDGSGEDSNCWGTDFWIDRLPVLSHHLEYFGLYDMSSGESYTILCAQKGDDE